MTLLLWAKKKSEDDYPSRTIELLSETAFCYICGGMFKISKLHEVVFEHPGYMWYMDKRYYCKRDDVDYDRVSLSGLSLNKRYYKTNVEVFSSVSDWD